MPVNVEEMIDSVLSIYDKRTQAKGIHVTRRYQLDGTTIKTHSGEIRQVFSTLLLNAIEAVDADGAIAVRVHKSSHWNNPVLHGVRITISDNGIGIHAHNSPRIFEPFFTTKGENEPDSVYGWRTGLWTVLELDSAAKQHASGQARDLLFDLFARQILSETFVTCYEHRRPPGRTPAMSELKDSSDFDHSNRRTPERP